MTLRYFVLLGILGLLPWLLWRDQWPMLVVEQLDHCPIVMCDFQRHYLPQAEIRWMTPTNQRMVLSPAFGHRLVAICVERSCPLAMGWHALARA